MLCHGIPIMISHSIYILYYIYILYIYIYTHYIICIYLGPYIAHIFKHTPVLLGDDEISGDSGEGRSDCCPRLLENLRSLLQQLADKAPEGAKKQKERMENGWKMDGKWMENGWKMDGKWMEHGHSWQDMVSLTHSRSGYDPWCWYILHDFG